jgi:hypothetical protein
MLTLINILILFFIILIIYQIILATQPQLVEGLKNKYEPYDTNNPNNALILAQQNAGNIAYIKEKLSDIENLSKEVQDLSGNYQNLQSQVDQLMQSQQDYANQMTGGSPPDITGATDEDDDQENT